MYRSWAKSRKGMMLKLVVWAQLVRGQCQAFGMRVCMILHGSVTMKSGDPMPMVLHVAQGRRAGRVYTPAEIRITSI